MTFYVVFWHCNTAPSLLQEAPPIPPHASSAPTSVLEAFNADNIAALRSCSSYAQLNPVLKGEEEGLPRMRFVLQDEAVVGPQHSYSEVALVKQPPRSGAAGQSSSRSGLPLQEAMRFAPAVSKKEEENAAHPYFNLSRVQEGWVVSVSLCVCVSISVRSLWSTYLRISRAVITSPHTLLPLPPPPPPPSHPPPPPSHPPLRASTTIKTLTRQRRQMLMTTSVCRKW